MFFYRLLLYASLLMLSLNAISQSSDVASLLSELKSNKNDTITLVIYNKLFAYYNEVKPDSAFFYATEMRDLARKMEMHMIEAAALDGMGYTLYATGRHAESLQKFLEAINIAENKNLNTPLPSPDRLVEMGSNRRLTSPEVFRLNTLGSSYHDLGHLYGAMEMYDAQLQQYLVCKKVLEQIRDTVSMCLVNMNLGKTYLILGDLEKALILENEAVRLAQLAGYHKYLGNMHATLGDIELKKGNAAAARNYYRMAIDLSFANNNRRAALMASHAMSRGYYAESKWDSSLYYAHQAHTNAVALNLQKWVYATDTLLADIHYGKGAIDSAYYYQSLSIAGKNQLFNAHQNQQVQQIFEAEQQRKNDAERAGQHYKTQLQKYLFLAGIALLLITAVLLMRNNKQKEKARKVLTRQRNELQEALEKLKSTQSQLVQSEKMASLGELTAGIAHEIQNPLNFVNNFSEVSSELVGELKTALIEGNTAEASTIASDIDQNLEKIVYHGKRADSIVKGMLQHSRSSSGEKVLTDINALADEYLRLSYHGLRAKDKSFNATYETHYDPQMGQVSVIPQDFGRVLLNLFTNSFYSINEKRKQATENYKPVLTLTTEKQNDIVRIIVNDNGLGIPEKVRNKIFQPFFTTKPTGEGTGLGLSLSYDIVTKGHGGNISVKSNEGEGAEFVIELPVLDHYQQPAL